MTPVMAKTAREKILEAALPLLVAHGRHGVTSEQIRAKAGVSNGSLFHAFPNKEAIAAALYVAAIESYQATVVAELNERRAASATIRALVKAHWDWLDDNELQARFLFGMGRANWSVETSRQTRGLNARMNAAFADWWAARAADVVDLEAEMAMAVLFGPSMTMMLSWLAGGAKPKGAAARLADAAVRSLVKGKSR